MFLSFPSIPRAVGLRLSKGIHFLAPVATIATMALTIIFWPSNYAKTQTHIQTNNGQVINDNYGTVILEQSKDMTNMMKSTSRENLRRLHYACLDDSNGGGLAVPDAPNDSSVIFRTVQPEKANWWYLDPMMMGSGPLLDLMKEHTLRDDYEFVEKMGVLAGKAVRGSLNTKEIMDIDEQIEGLKMSSALKSLFGSSGYSEEIVVMLLGDTEKRISLLEKKRQGNQYEKEMMNKNNEILAQGMPRLCRIIVETYRKVN